MQASPIEVLCFGLGSEEYGISILTVQEIRGYDRVTAIPDARTHLNGVINLRGDIVPIVDLRIKFQLGRAGYDSLAVVIIMNLANSTVGVVVDRVPDVITLSNEQIKSTPETSSK